MSKGLLLRNYKFVIKGKVQGVWYRKTIAAKANRLGISGYVRNLDNGSVEAACTVDDNSLKMFIAVLEKGSLASRVKSIKTSECEEHFNGGFEIR